MGKERWYVAVVDGGRLLERSCAEPAFGESLMVPSLFGRDRRRRNPDGLDAEFLAEVDAMNRAHPGIEARICTLDRSFDVLHYLLSDGRRRGEFDGADPGTWAIRGALALPDHLRGGQGHPIRYTPPAEARGIAAWLAGRTVADLRAACDPAAMERQCVYKFRADRVDESWWGGVAGHFAGLRSFYAAVATHGEGVLAIVT